MDEEGEFDFQAGLAKFDKEKVCSRQQSSSTYSAGPILGHCCLYGLPRGVPSASDAGEVFLV